MDVSAPGKVWRKRSGTHDLLVGLHIIEALHIDREDWNVVDEPEYHPNSWKVELINLQVVLYGGNQTHLE